jgi:CheY-like chemotaxis protein
LGQILINLGNNAVKFTHYGGITIKVDLDKRKDGLLRLRFNVRDTGIGISLEQQQRLFQSFNQADSSTSRRYGGSGLGLAICARLCGLMGGEIRVESELGRGACFHFTVQLQESDAALTVQPSTGIDEAVARLRGAKILLVEDNELNRELVTELLTDNGIMVTSAWNGREAVALLQDERFDGVLMDIQMPAMDGYTATKKIREQARFKDLPLIAMTANVMADALGKAEAAGMNDHIGKPLEVDRMFSTMARWIVPSEPAGEEKTRSEPMVLEKDTPWSFDRLIGVDTAQGLQRSNHKPALYQRLLVGFRNSERNFGEKFLAARQSDDPRELIRIAHTLKGVAGTIGATGVEQVAEELESACIQRKTEAVEGLAQQVVAELAPVIEGIDRMIAANRQPAPLMDSEQLTDVFERLATLLRQDDPNALQAMEALARLLPQQDIQELNRAVAEFDFEAALHHLAKLEDHHEQ